MRDIGTPQILGRKRLRIVERSSQRFNRLAIVAGSERLDAILEIVVPARFFLCRSKQRRKNNYADTPPAVTPDLSHMRPPKLSRKTAPSRDCSDEIQEFRLAASLFDGEVALSQNALR